MSMFDALLRLESKLTIPSPLEQLSSPLLISKQLNVYIKRDDCIDPFISGNKYRKLKGHLTDYFQNANKYNGILSFGGAYSNHLYATSAACHQLNIPFTAIVRGEEVDLDNTTLSLLVLNGHTIHRIARSEYRLKQDGDTVKSLMSNRPLYIIPEGGNSPLSKVGVQDIYKEIVAKLHPDYIALASGTGATALGLLSAASDDSTKLIVSAGARDQSVRQQLEQIDTNKQLIWFEEEWGGFGKKKPELPAFMDSWSSDYGIPIEYVYTGKLLFRLWSLIASDYFTKGSTLVIIHTGGLRPDNH